MSIKIKETGITPGLRLNARAIALVLGVIVLIGAFVFIDGADKAVATEAIKPPSPALPSRAVLSLPSTYEMKKEAPPLPLLPPSEGASAVEDGMSAEFMKLEHMERLNKKKRALQTRLQEVFVPVRGDIGRGNRAPPTRERAVDGSLDPLKEGEMGERGESFGTSGTDQESKRSFVTNGRSGDEVLSKRLRSPVTEYQVMAGTQIPGVLITGINSDLPGQILGQVSQNTFDSVTGKYLLIPQGTKIVGEYDSRIGYGQERVLIVWTRLLFPNGKSLSLEGMPGVDMSGYAGLADKVNNHYLKLLSGVVVSSVLSAGSRVAQGGSRTVDPSLGQLGAEGFAMNVDDVGQQIARKNLNIQPTIEIEPGKRFSIFVNKDLVLEPYR
jgi:type IV secretion system protein VirB10